MQHFWYVWASPVVRIFEYRDLEGTQIYKDCALYAEKDFSTWYIKHCQHLTDPYLRDTDKRLNVNTALLCIAESEKCRYCWCRSILIANGSMCSGIWNIYWNQRRNTHSVPLFRYPKLSSITLFRIALMHQWGKLQKDEARFIKPELSKESKSIPNLWFLRISALLQHYWHSSMLLWAY